MCHRSESCYHCKYTLKTLVTNFNLSEKQRSTLFLNKTLSVLLRNSVYSVLHHAEPNVPVQFMYVDQHWRQRQQIMAEASFLCQPSHLWWGAEIYPSNHWVGCRAVPSHQPISGHTHTSFPHTQIQLRVSNQCVFGLWENIGKVKNPPTQGKKADSIQNGSKTSWIYEATRVIQ